ncbi:MAG TPA: hypothetical protein VNO52_16895, partial [Methylomirabilota bacterium]|nr:hypothetical protein [Methylomirabilota bacterium]
PKGPYVRVEGTNVFLIILEQKISGNFVFEQLTRADGQRVVRLALTDGTLSLGDPDSPLIRVTGGTGKLVLTPAGLAGEFGGTLQINIDPSIQFTGALNVAINNTNAVVNEDFVVGEERVRLDLPAGPYLRVELGRAAAPASLSILGQTLSGLFAFEQVTNSLGQKRVRVAATHVGLSLGGVVEVEDGQGSFLLGPDGLAGSISATVRLNNLPEGVEFSGRFGLSINKTSRSVNETFTVAGQNITLNLPAGPYLRVEGLGVQLAVAGQTLDGNFAFEQVTSTDQATMVTRTATRIVATNITLRIGSGGTDFVTLTNGHGAFLLTAGGMAGTLGGTVALNVPGVAFAGTFTVSVNTTAGEVHEQFTVASVNGGTVLTSLNAGRGVDNAILLTGTVDAPANGQFVHPVAAALDPAVAVASPVLFLLKVAGVETPVFLTAEAQADNSTVAHLISDLNAALATAGVGSKVRAELAGTKIRFRAIDPGVNSLSVTAAFGAFHATRALTATVDGPADGRFSEDVAVTLRVDGQDFVVAVTEAAQGDNADLADLLDDFTDALGAATLSTRLVVESVAGRIRFRAIDSSIASLQIVGSTLPGFTGSDATPTDAVLTLTAGAEAPATGQYSGEMAFLITVNGTATPVTISVADQSDNAAPSDLVTDFKAALMAAGLDALLDVELAGNQIQFIAIDDSVMSFSITVQDVPGFGVDQASDGHFEITRRDGQSFVVNLGGTVTLDDVVRAINDAARATNTPSAGITATLDGTRLKIVDTSTGAGALTITALGEFTAANDLGLLDGATTTAGQILGAELATSAPVELMVPAGPYLRVDGEDVTLEVAGQTLTGNFSFEQVTKQPGGQKVIKITASEVELHLGNGPEDFVVVSEGTGTFLVTAAGLAGELSAEIEVMLPGIDVDGKVAVAINNTTVAVNEVFTIGTGPDAEEIELILPAGPYVRVEVSGRGPGQPATFEIMGQVLEGNFAFEQATTTTNQKVVRVGFSQVGLRIGDGSMDFITLSGGEGAFVMTPAGMAGQLSGTVAIPAIGFSGTLGLAINNTSQRVNERVEAGGAMIVIDLPAGPYLRVEGTNISLMVAGQSLTGDFAFERSTSTPTTPGGMPRTVIRVAAANVSLRLGNGTTDFVRVSDGRGALLITQAGLAGSLAATVELNVPGVEFSGRFNIDINNTMMAVNEVFTVGAVDGLTLLSAIHGGAGAEIEETSPHFQITRRDGVQLNVDLSGATTVNDVLTRINNAVGNQDGKLVATLDGTRLKLVDSSTKVGSNVLTVAALGDSAAADDLGLSGVTATSAADADTLTGEALNSVELALPPGPYLKVAGIGVTLELLGQRISGDFAFERITSTNPQNNQTSQVIRVIARNVTISLGDGNTEFVAVTGGSGSLIITSAGLAGEFGATVELKNIPDVTFSGTFKVQINNTNQQVRARFDGINPGDPQTELNLPAGPYISVAGTGVMLNIAGVGVQGNFVFEQITTRSGAKVIRIAATEVGFSLRSGDDVIVSVSGASGALLITPQGIAGKLTFRISPSTFQIADFSLPLTLDLTVEINNLRVAVDETFVLGDDTIHLDLPAGPYLRIAAENVALTLGSVTLTGDFQFEQITRAGNVRVLRLAMANVSIAVPGDNPVVSDARGGFIIKKVGARTGVAGILTGKVSGAGGGFALDATLGFRLNTTRAAVDETIEVGGRSIAILFTQAESQNGNVFGFFATDLRITIADFVSLEGSFSFSSGGPAGASRMLAGEGIDLFVGQGPFTLENGDPNPDAVGVLLTNTSLLLLDFGGGRYALEATGTVRLVGLDGLNAEGRATVRINNTGQTISAQSVVIPGTTPERRVTMDALPDGTLSFQGTLSFRVADTIEISGSVAFTKKPNGVVQVAIAGAAVKVWIPGQTDPAFSIGGNAIFTIGGAEGFRLQNIQVNNFSIFGQGAGLGGSSGTAPPPIRFLTADLAEPYSGLIRDRAELNARGYIDVVFEDPNGRGIKESTIVDAAPEFTVLVNGQPLAGVTFGTPTKVAGSVNRYRYAFTGIFPTDGEVTVTFLPQSWTDNGGMANFGETEIFTLVTKRPDGTIPPLGPTAMLTNPGSGGTVTADALNAQQYLDITFTTRNGSPIDPATINGDEFALSGAGLADVQLDAMNRPVLATAPILISGTTYRYYLKDRVANNGVGLFKAGEVEITFLTGTQGGFKTRDNLANPAGTARFTIEPNAAGPATGTGPIALGPITLQGPTIGIQDIGFKSGKLVVTIGLGANRATLGFGGSSPMGTMSTQQANSGITAELLGVLGTFDVAIDVFGLLGGKVDIGLTGKFSLNVASLNVTVPNVVQITGSGIRITYDPAGTRDQELLRVYEASVVFPSFNVSGQILPYNTTLGQSVAAPDPGSPTPLTPGAAPPANIIPGLVVRMNGFSLGQAVLVIGGNPQPGTTPAQSTASDGKIRFGSILEFDDIRIGVTNFTVNFDAENPVDFDGSIFVASGGVKFFPGRPFSATIIDRMTAEPGKDLPGKPDTEAIRLSLTFTDGRVDAFQFDVDTFKVQLGSFLTLTGQDVRLDTGAGPDEFLVRFGAIGAEVKIGSLVIGGEGRNFGFTGDGSFRTLPGFGVFLSVGGTTGDTFKWPAWLPIRINELGVQWDDIENRPEDFVLTLSASVTGLQGLSGLEFSGAIEGVKIDVGMLLEGKFPIVDIASIGVSVRGAMFGGQINAALIGGIIKL